MHGWEGQDASFILPLSRYFRYQRSFDKKKKKKRTGKSDAENQMSFFQPMDMKISKDLGKDIVASSWSHQQTDTPDP